MGIGRRGFTLLEMIVMIVVLGIAFATLPMILGVSAATVASVADVRGMYHGAAKMQIVLNKPWDEGNVDDFDTGGIYYVLRTGESDAPGERLYCDNDKNRSGHYPGLDRRMCESADASGIGREGGSYDDIDDFADAPSDSVGDGYTVSADVVYVGYREGPVVSFFKTEGTVAGTSNIKKVTVTVSERSDPACSLVTYRYYAANIGQPKPYIKRND